MNKALEMLRELQECDGQPVELYKRIDAAIEELLAQPEPKPVGIVITIGGYPDDSEHTVKLTCRHRDLKDGDLLYTSPPKREPMSDTRCPYPEETSGEYRDGFTDGILYAEKHHGIEK